MCMNQASRLCECCGPMPDARRRSACGSRADAELAAREVVQLRGLVEDLIHRDADEVEELDLDTARTPEIARPMAKPTVADSASGPSRTTSWPKRSQRPRVTPKVPP